MPRGVLAIAAVLLLGVNETNAQLRVDKNEARDPTAMTGIAAQYGVEVDFERTAPIVERHGLTF